MKTLTPFTRGLFALFTLLFCALPTFADIPVASVAGSPVWYRIQLSNWSDTPGRAQRVLSTNGVNLFSTPPSTIINTDNNLFRLDGSALTNVKLLSRSGYYAYAVSGNNNTPVKVKATVDGATSWSVYSNSSISGTYYMGILGNTSMRINAGASLPGSFEYSWGMGLYDQPDNASAWIFTRVYGAPVNVACDATQGEVYIGTTEGVLSAEVISQAPFTLHAVENAGYIFKEWKLAGVRVSTDATYTAIAPAFTASGAAMNYTAVFERDIENRTATPTFTTSSTGFKVGQSAEIRVSCTAPGATIYYTLDGTEPTTTSLVATGGLITLDTSAPGSYTVSIVAKTPELSLSRIVSNIYRIISVNAPAALLPLPNDRQMYYMHNPHAAFIHYGMNTYTNKEWGTGRELPSSFNPPKEVNTDQWVSVLKECGFDRVLLTGKHHDGFCLWPSKANKVAPHTIAQSPYLGGKGDLFESLSLSCTKYGLDMGVYLSPWDAYEENVGGNYTNTKYNDFYNIQLDEVLSAYGRYNEKLGRREICEIWLDGATGSNNPPVYDFRRFVTTMRKHQPTAFVWIDAFPAFQENADADTCRIDGSWAMNESGQAPEPCWNKLSIVGSATNDCKNKENGKYYHLLEADVSIRPGWFYGDGGGLKTAKDLFLERYLKSIGRGIPLILNIPPDTNGVFADNYVEVLRKYKEYLDVSFAKSLIPAEAVIAASQVRADDEQFAGAMALDNDYDTYWTMNDEQTTGTLTVTFGKKVRFDMVQFQEYVPLGQRIKSFTIEVLVDGLWKSFGSGSTVGYKRIVKAREVEASAVRLNITASLAVPLINSLAVYRSHEDLIETDLPPAVGEDGQFAVSETFMAADETDGSIDIKVRIVNRSNKEVSVYVSTLPGTGVQGKVYQDKSQTLVFEPGATEKTFTVELINNTNTEGYKDFYVEVSSPSEGTSIGLPNRTQVLVFDEDQPRLSRTITISSQDVSKGEVAFVYPATTSGLSITTTSPLIAEATPAEGYTFVGWYSTIDNSLVSNDMRYIDVRSSAGQPTSSSLQARFDEKYPVMTHTFTGGGNQQNRFLRSVTTSGTLTPTVFTATTIAELPYSAFPTASVGNYVTSGALIDKRRTPIEIQQGITSFSATFYGWTTPITGYSSELNWTQQGCFIDWNKDGLFTGTEILAKSSNTVGDDGGVSASFISAAGYTRTISVPVGQLPGTYRMRVVYFEPQENAQAWQNILFTELNARVRNGLSYDFDIKVKGSDVHIFQEGGMQSIVYAKQGAIVCRTVTLQEVAVYTMSGTGVYREKQQGEVSIAVQQGVYIVRIGSDAHKVHVW